MVQRGPTLAQKNNRQTTCFDYRLDFRKDYREPDSIALKVRISGIFEPGTFYVKFKG